ncbi:MAG: hypothetical protein WBF27_01280, partial [Xanthobacteraceae bacterium]
RVISVQAIVISLESSQIRWNHNLLKSLTSFSVRLSSTPIGPRRWSVAVSRMDRVKVHYQGEEEREVVVKLDASSDDQAVQEVRQQIDKAEIS